MKVVLIGSGNLATHLGHVLHESGDQIVQVWSRSLTHATRLADQLSASATDDWAQVDLQADVYLLLIRDTAIPMAAQQLTSLGIDQLVLHCSGATDLQALSSFRQHGVLYPVQSFSKDIPVDFKQIPLGVEANTPDAYARLNTLASPLSTRVFDCNSEQRLALHLSAVFVNNFSNALFQISHDLLTRHQLSFDLIKPILKETVDKALEHVPIEVQTGPAVRGDQATLEKHLKFLSTDPDWQLIYQQISALISKKKANNS